MKNLTLILSLLLIAPLFAQDLDTELRRLIKSNDINPLDFKRDLTSPLYQLGQKLFSDNDLSGNKNISCQTCHHPEMGGSDNLPLPIGQGGEGLGRDRKLGTGSIIPRNAPHLFNLGMIGLKTMFWDGRVSFDPATKVFTTPESGINGINPAHPEYCEPLSSALSAQAMFPPLSHDEMRGQPGSNEVADAKTNFEAWALLTKRITSKKDYMDLFRQAMPGTPKDKINFAHIGEALGHFQANRFAVTHTPFDKYLTGDNSSMSDAAKRGASLFLGRARCVLCHSGSNFTDDDFHNVAFPQVGPGKEEGGDDKGLFLETGKQEDLYKFKTPSLRNIALSPPYGHSGSLKSLIKVIQHYQHPMRSNHHYDGGFRGLPYALDVDWDNMNTRLRLIDPLLGRMGVPMNMMEMQDIATFLKEGLTDENFK